MVDVFQWLLYPSFYVRFYLKFQQVYQCIPFGFPSKNIDLFLKIRWKDDVEVSGVVQSAIDGCLWEPSRIGSDQRNYTRFIQVSFTTSSWGLPSNHLKSSQIPLLFLDIFVFVSSFDTWFVCFFWGTQIFFCIESRTLKAEKLRSGTPSGQLLLGVPGSLKPPWTGMVTAKVFSFSEGLILPHFVWCRISNLCFFCR